jgi:uncharacterized protein (TIGR02145 family)
VATTGELDNETTPSYTLNVEITKADTTTQSANITITVTDVAEGYVSESLSFNGLTYATVQSPDTGKIWLDRNLGASRACTSDTDSACYGYYYQWGRDDDGHQQLLGVPITTNTVADSINPGNGSFIEVTSAHKYDWTSADSDGALRSAAWRDGGSANICPTGYSVPTAAEFNDEFDNPGAGMTLKSGTSAYDSFLKFPNAGQRGWDTVMVNVGTWGYIWVADPYAAYATHYYYRGGSFGPNPEGRGTALSIRCLKTS